MMECTRFSDRGSFGTYNGYVEVQWDDAGKAVLWHDGEPDRCRDCEFNLRVQPWLDRAQRHYRKGEWAEARTASLIGANELSFWEIKYASYS